MRKILLFFILLLFLTWMDARPCVYEKGDICSLTNLEYMAKLKEEPGGKVLIGSREINSIDTYNKCEIGRIFDVKGNN